MGLNWILDQAMQPLSPIDWITFVLALLAAAPSLYLLSLVPLAMWARLRDRSGGAVGEPGHLVFVVPAHNEENDIETTLRDLSAHADAETSIHVIADNCADRTAELVRAFAASSKVPVVLWERFDDTKKAKGYALEWGLPQIFQWSDARQQPTAFVCIVDADATLSPGSVGRARSGFAAGRTVLQSVYVFGEGLGMRADVMRIASGAFSVRGLARSVLGLSDTLKGNGMWFRRSVIEESPWAAYSLAEDLEYTFTLVRKGHRVHVMPHSFVTGRLAATTGGERDQRLRWEGGRWAVVKGEVPRLLGEMLRAPSWTTLDLLVELLIPPLGLLVALQAAVFATSAALSAPMSAAVVVLGWVALGVYVVASVPIVGLPLRLWLALLYVPFYVVWKIALLPATIVSSRSKRWVRTSR